ncbi:MAG: M6 family metalloprotease domain-containing protein [FCB group bacterium]|nr:M6 family metalloprotease domain-containing protein [FCB group bacterium]
MVKVRSQKVNLEVLVLTALILVLLAGQARPMPPHPDVQELIESGQVHKPLILESITRGTERLKVNTQSIANGTNATGTFKVLCLLVDFSDKVSRVSSTLFDSLIFADQAGTVRDYFAETSYGQLDIVAVTLPSSLGWYEAPQSYAYYVDNNYGTDSPYPNNSQKLCEDLVDLADPNVDFSQYDNDGDGHVDVVIIVHAGQGAELTGRSTDIWSHKWSIPPRQRDGVSILDYTVMPEYWLSSGDITIGVFCHELGHAFGLPDLYDTDGSSKGVGDWSLMSTGSWNGYLGDSPAHPDAWCKAQLGWIDPVTVTLNLTNQSIPAVESNPTVYKIPVDGGSANEYFLVENRQKIGYDAHLPGEGLLIWHIDDQATHNQYEWYPGHTIFGHYLVALEQADNLYQLEKNIASGDAGDPFPGNSSNVSFTPGTSPSSEAYDGSGGYVSIVNISASGPVMTADFVVSLVAVDEETPILPQFELGQNYPNPFNPVTSISYSIQAESMVEIYIYNTLGQKVRKLVNRRYSPGNYTVIWDGTDNEGRGLPTGIYLYKLITDESSLARKMLLIK